MSGTVVVDATVDVTGSVAGVRLVMSTVDDGSPMDGVVSGGSVTFVVVPVVAASASLSRARWSATVTVIPARVSAIRTPRRAETIGSTYPAA